MAQRTISRALAIGMIASAMLSFSGPASAQDDKPPAPKKGCVIYYVDGKDKIIGQVTVPHGTQIAGGLFSCDNGKWSFAWGLFSLFVSGDADTVVLDEKDQLRDVIGVRLDTHEGKLQMQEILSVVERFWGQVLREPGPAIVMDASGHEAELTADELAALFDGREVEGVRVLATARPGLETTLNELLELGDETKQIARDPVKGKRVAIRLGDSDWWFVGTINCTKQADGNENCVIDGKFVKR